MKTYFEVDDRIINEIFATLIWILSILRFHGFSNEEFWKVP